MECGSQISTLFSTSTLFHGAVYSHLLQLRIERPQPLIHFARFFPVPLSPNTMTIVYKDKPKDAKAPPPAATPPRATAASPLYAL